ncbi:sigma factor-like helix-turn-helix DNA-binding protein [Streptomyces ossamyceticus]|nr:sigma factor-like helix-turn-helix DNA-binding protein [Streptomyces ossamyceticus]
MTCPEDSGSPARSGSFRTLDGLYGMHYEMPRSFDAFYRTYARAHWDYARRVLGDKEAAKEVVRTLYAQLGPMWDGLLLEERSPESYAWRILTLLVQNHDLMTTVSAVGGGDAAPSAGGQAAVVHDAVRAVLWNMRSQLAAADSPLGLYTAIAALPARQFDVVILHYVMGYTCGYVAEIMGISVCTVRSHRRQAYKRLAVKLRSHLGDDGEKE